MRCTGWSSGVYGYFEPVLKSQFLLVKEHFLNQVSK
jgi:hypothetical protein